MGVAGAVAGLDGGRGMEDDPEPAGTIAVMKGRWVLLPWPSLVVLTLGELVPLAILWAFWWPPGLVNECVACPKARGMVGELDLGTVGRCKKIMKN
jgi:hypothetical protein